MSLEEQYAELQRLAALLGVPISLPGNPVADLQRDAVQDDIIQDVSPLLKRPPDGCTPDVWDAYGRLMQYEPLPK